MLVNFEINQWQEYLPDSTQHNAINALEEGNILFLPKLDFPLLKNELQFLTSEYADPNSKNISLQCNTQRLWGVRHLSNDQHLQLKRMLTRYCQAAHDLIRNLFPHYSRQLITGRTSYRPQQAANRKSSYRKDDQRLHVDAFPSAPNQGKRILRVFTNINPHGEARVWRIGEPFPLVAEQFIQHIKKPLPGLSTALRMLRITKSYRTAYDHYMLRLHDMMKANMEYQKNAQQQEVHFPANSSWVVMTDEVSHAAMSGQYLMEQTFYLPVQAMGDENKSPLHVLQKLLGRKLI
jgi:hypothetical protein